MEREERIRREKEEMKYFQDNNPFVGQRKDNIQSRAYSQVRQQISNDAYQMKPGTSG